MCTKDLKKELDDTIDQLIENSITLESIHGEEYALEIQLLMQTQESLLAHLFHLDEKISGKKQASSIDSKKIENFSLESLNLLQAHSSLKTEKIKLSKIRLKSKNSSLVS